MRQHLCVLVVFLSPLVCHCSPSQPKPVEPTPDTPSATVVPSTTPSASASTTASTAPSTAPSASASSSAPAGVMMLDDDLLKRVSKKGELYVVTLKKQAAKKCTVTVVATIVGARKGDLEVACSMELKPGDYVIAIEAAGPMGKQITSAASVVPGLADAAAKAHVERIKTLK